MTVAADSLAAFGHYLADIAPDERWSWAATFEHPVYGSFLVLDPELTSGQALGLRNELVAAGVKCELLRVGQTVGYESLKGLGSELAP